MARYYLRLFLIVAAILLLVPLHYLWKLFRRRSLWPRRFLFWVAWVSGMRVRTTGTPLRSRVLYAANHLSWLDIMVLAGASGAAFVSKVEVARWPVVGWLAGLNNTVYVDRAERGAVRGQADALRNALGGGQPVALFPEGGTEGGTSILPFRASLFASLFPPVPGVMVQPVAIDYGAAGDEIAWTDDEPAGANGRRVLSRRGTVPVTIHFLEPLDPAAYRDRKAVAAAAQAAVEAALGASAPPSVARADRL